MPLERKILLSILVLIILGFTGYYLYGTYYLDYKDKLGKIEKYGKLLEKSSNIAEEINPEELENLKKVNSEYRALYFEPEDADPVTLAPEIINRLEKHGLAIKQYTIGDTSVRYSISGKKWNLTSFLYSLTLEKRNYRFPVFNIRMINNQEFQGVIEIERVTLPSEVRDRNFSKEIQGIPYRAPYSNRVSYPLGLDFEVKEEVITEVAPEPEIVELPTTTDKFQFIGYLKGESETTLLFKERTNGRIYRFTKGEILSGWKYIEEREDSWLFLYNNKEFKVYR